jgi:hypothetical protein
MNHKSAFIRRGFIYLLRNNLLFMGTSPGTLGSRASNLRSRDILYKPQGQQLLFLGNFSSPATKEVYRGLYTEEYHRSAASFINILAQPFSSLFSFIFENGIIGTLLLLLCLFYSMRVFINYHNIHAIESCLMICLIFLWGIFDTIWERPFIMGVFYLILAINFRSLQSESTASDKYVPQ